MILTSVFIAGTIGAGNEDIGGFDIEKVRNAAMHDDTLGNAQSPAAERENLTAVVIRITLYLGVVILLIIGITWIFRRNGQGVPGGTGGAMDIIETLPTGQNRMILMVRVMDEIYMLSQTASNITMIDKIGGQKALDIIASSKSGGTIINFKDAFNNFMGKIKKTS